MKEKGKGDKMQGEARKYSANQPANEPRSRIPYFEGLSSISLVFKVPGKLEKMTTVGNRIILNLNIEGTITSVTYKGKLPKACLKHQILIYRETRGFKDRIQVWDSKTGKQYYGTFR